MLSPLVRWHYLTWLLPALMACLDVALQHAKQSNPQRDWRPVALRWWPSAVLALIYYLLVVGLPITKFRAPAAGTLLLWLLCGALYLWSAGERPSQEVITHGEMPIRQRSIIRRPAILSRMQR
jgi:hypothetical protein